MALTILVLRLFVRRAAFCGETPRLQPSPQKAESQCTMSPCSANMKDLRDLGPYIMISGLSIWNRLQ